MKVFGIAGYSGSGKTTLLEKLIPCLTARGLKVSVIKHAHHGFDIDRPGKDTWRHAQAGADVVCISSRDKFALIKKTQRDMPLEEIVARVDDVDIILVEGYKNHSALRVEIFRQSSGREPLDRPGDLLAVIADIPLLYPGPPHFGLDDAVPFANFLELFIRDQQP